MAIKEPTWTYKSKGDKQTASEMNELAQAVIINATELSNTKYDVDGLINNATSLDNRITAIEESGPINQADGDDLENIIINGAPVIRKKTTKTYRPETYSGMGRVILRKNMVNGVNVLTQEMINQVNTIYEIRYDFDLNGEEITIPENCVLDFQGGSLNNGVIVGLRTGISNNNTSIFKNIYLQGKWNVKEFKAEWFGVVGDNTSDNTLNLKYLVDALRNIDVIFVEFRKYIETSPTIKFCSSYAYRITEPFLIDIPCNTVGNPLFYYDGEKIEDGGAVVISRQFNKHIELSVTSTLSENVDLSDNIRFGGIKLINVQFCNIKIGSILGFHAGIYLHCISLSESPNSNQIRCGYINHCIYGVLVNSINSGYSNANNFFDAIYSGQNDTVVPSIIDHGAFIKFIGDGSYGADSILLSNIHIEGKIANSKDVYFIEIELDQPKGFGFFEIENCRIERTGGTFIKSNCTLYDMGISSLTYKSNETLYAELTQYNIRIPIDDKILSFFGFDYQEANYTNSLRYNYTEASSLLESEGQYYSDNEHYGLMSTTGSKITHCSVNELSVFIPYKLSFSPNQVIGIDRVNTKLMFVLIFDEDENPIFITNNISSYGFSVINTDSYSLLQSNERSLKYYIKNDSNEEYFVYIMSNNNFDIRSDKSLTINEIDWKIKRKGNISDRPTLSAQCVGSTFFDLQHARRKPIWWNSFEWVDAFGNNADYQHWGLFSDKPENPEIGYMYYCTDKRKPNSDKYHLPIFYAGEDIWVDSDGFIVDENYPKSNSGSTSERPTNVYIGFQYFDTTLNKPIWWTGTNWVDATGASV